jgi:hypothetical protein
LGLLSLLPPPLQNKKKKKKKGNNKKKKKKKGQKGKEENSEVEENNDGEKLCPLQSPFEGEGSEVDVINDGQMLCPLQSSNGEEGSEEDVMLCSLQSLCIGEGSEVDENNDEQMLCPPQSPILTVARIEQKEQEWYPFHNQPSLDECPTITMMISLSSEIDSKEEEQPSMQLQHQLTVCIMCNQKEKEKEDLHKIITQLESQGVESAKRLHASRQDKFVLKTEINNLKTEIVGLNTKMDLNDARLKTEIVDLKTEIVGLNTKMDLNDVRLNEVIFQFNTMTKKNKKSADIFQTGRGMFLRLLIYDARNFITTKLNRSPEIEDNIVLWNKYLNNLSAEDLVSIDMTPDLIQFMIEQMFFCNATVHQSDKLLVAATITYHLTESTKKDTWTLLFNKVYNELPHEMILRS